MKSYHAKLTIIFCLGFFTLFAQTLLFRNFLEVFEGNELSVGLFFFSWLIWVALGALAARKKALAESLFLQRHYEFFLLLCIPAFILQKYLFLNAADILGTAAFERISLEKLIPAALLFNAPISFLSGTLFVSGCKWIRDCAIPVAKVYVWECGGSFAGAAAITLLLYFRLPETTVFWGASGTVAAIVFAFQFAAKGKSYVKLSLSFAVSLIFFAGIVSGLDKKLSEWNKLRQWERIMPGSKYTGSFASSQARYSYGRYKDRFVVAAWGETLETFPDSLNAAEELATNLAEKPDAKKILVISPGALFFCNELASLKQVEKVVWLDPDAEYPHKLLSAVGEEIKINLEKIEMPEEDLRSLLKNKNAFFDLIILRLPNPSSLALNRYFTLQNFALLKKALKQKGVLSASFPGGENFMGPELSYFGASLLFTLQKEFKKIILKPGERSIFFASDSGSAISENGQILKKRLAKITGLSSIYPPENILSSFAPDRIKFQMNAYGKIIETAKSDLLLNSDTDPKSFLYALLSSVKRLGDHSVKISLIDRTNRLLPPLILCIALIFLVFRGAYIFRQKALSSGGAFLDLCESLFIVFAASFAGMLLNMILIFNFQMQFGSIFLYFGLIVSLFMLGLFAGGLFMDILLEKKGFHCRGVSMLTLILAAFIFIFCRTPEHSKIYFAFLFFVSGFFLGIYMPFSAFQMKLSEFSDRKASSALDSLDHFAGASGGLLSSLVFLPVLGERRSYTIIFLALASIFIATFFFAQKEPQKTKGGKPWAWIISGIFTALLSAFLIWNAVSYKKASNNTKNETKSENTANKTKQLIKSGKLSAHEAMDFSE